MTTRRRFATADVFTEERFRGNPLAVVLDAEGLRTCEMQSLAAEFGYVETTFVLPPDDPAHQVRVRIFTPDREIAFAGHPNIGTAFVVARERLAAGAHVPDTFVFEELSGLVTVDLIRDAGEVVGGDLLTPQGLRRLSEVSPTAAASCLSIETDEVRLDRHGPQVVSMGLPFLVVEVASRDVLRRVRPNREAYDRLLPLDGARSVYAYAAEGGERGSHQPERLHARMFTWRLVEDPATGSATAALAALLADLSGKPVTLEVRQGEDMGRSSTLRCRSVVIGSEVWARVHGRCVAMFDGSFVC